MRFLSIAVLILSSAGQAGADTLVFRDGRAVDGTFLGATARQIRMDIGGHAESFDIGNVVSISFGNPEPAPMPPAANYQPPQRGYAPPPQAYAGGFEIPAGSNFVVRLIDAVDSERNRVGQTFRGSMDEPVFINGQQVVPRGADVVLRLVDSRESGKLTGRASLTLSLQTVAVNGRMMAINTQTFTAVSGSRGARTAKMGLGGAGVGAAIGAIAGGGKGAAIGAGAGGAAGLGVEVLTKGQRVRIPSETRLSFVLDVPVRM